jgi:hypothetical protein
MMHVFMIRPGDVIGHRHVPHALARVRPSDSYEDVEGDWVRAMGDGEERRHSIPRRVSAHADRKRPRASNVANGSDRERGDRILELAGVRSMDDRGKQKDFGFDRRPLETAIHGSPSDMVRALRKHGADEAVLTFVPAEGSREGGVVRPAQPKPGYGGVCSPLVARLELLGFVQEAYDA